MIPELLILQADEVIELNDAKIRYNPSRPLKVILGLVIYSSTQADGTVNFVASDLNTRFTNGATFTTNGQNTFINGERIDTGNQDFPGNTISKAQLVLLM